MNDNNITERSNPAWFRRGLETGFPIMLGYFAVSLTIGITARIAGLSALQAALSSLLLNASAGEYAAFTVMAAGAGLLEAAVMELVANARYLLMSCSLSQKFSENTRFIHRLIIGFFITDEYFGAAVAVPEKLNPFYYYGMVSLGVPGWVTGTYLGVLLGNILPPRILSALGVALYGMFIAIIIPPAKKSRIIALVISVSFLSSYLLNRLAIFDFMSSSLKIILLTVVIYAAAAVIFPRKEDEQ